MALMELPFSPAVPILTPRLILRPFEPGDLEPLLVFHSDPASVRYVPFAPRDRAGMVSELAQKIGRTTVLAEGDRLDLAVVTTADQAVIGDVMLALRSVLNETVEVGYIFSPASTGQGYATETVRTLLDLAFGQLRARRVIARVDLRNGPSRAVLERLGLRLEAELLENEWFKGELTSEVDYAVLAREWQDRPRED
jgi:RimJ/RimL family protein N-acetyltransferase